MKLTKIIFNKSSEPLVLILFYAPVFLILMCILIINFGNFTYTLDDPYIHLELAKNIVFGNYGINSNEYSAPSSSIIWPLILAPFMFAPKIGVYAPLLLNIIFSLMTFNLLLRNLNGVGGKARGFILAGWCLATNFYGLIFSGMEHSLQVFLVTFIALEVIDREFSFNERPPQVLYFAIFLLPLVRYEGLAISLPTLLYLFLGGDKKRALLCGLLVFSVIFIFSIFLNYIGVGFVPSSIVAKSDIDSFYSLFKNVISNFKQYGFVFVIILCFCFYIRARRNLALLVVLATVLHAFFGKIGWYGRYEVYWLTFVGMFLMRFCIYSIGERRSALVFGLLPLAFIDLLYPTLTAPMASAAIYNQQYAMSMIAKSIDENVAVNDLGLVALNSDNYVLDLLGLGSIEALHLRKSKSDADWIKSLMKKNNVKYAFIYDDWFFKKPDNWIKVAELTLLIPKIAVAKDTVAFYATDMAAASKLKSVIKSYKSESSDEKFKITYNL